LTDDTTDPTSGGFEPVCQDPFLERVLLIAAAENGVIEDPKTQNQGPRVDEYIRSVGLNPAGNPPCGYPWCMGFVYWCFEQAALALGQSNPCTRTAGVVHHWEVTKGKKILASDVANDHSLVTVGMVFCKSEVDSHTGIVCQVTDAGILTIEGNTNEAGSREGNAVVAGKLRPWGYVQLGFIDYAGLSVSTTAPIS
jgi:hypothetical protein